MRFLRDCRGAAGVEATILLLRQPAGQPAPNVAIPSEAGFIVQ